VRVGRSALDEDAIRLIEQHNPDVEFDWTRILKGQDAPPEPKANIQPERRARPLPRELPAQRQKPSWTAPVPVAPVPDPSPLENAGPPATFDLERISELPAPDAATPVDVPIGNQPQSFVPENSPVDGPFSPGSIADAPAPDDRPDQPTTPAQARLGYEGLSRLRARHAEVLARISERATDPAQREQLKSDAERLNPDTWVTDAEVTAGLESYETVFEALRGVVGRRRKRRGRPPGASQTAGAEAPPGADEGPNEPGEDA